MKLEIQIICRRIRSASNNFKVFEILSDASLKVSERYLGSYACVQLESNTSHGIDSRGNNNPLLCRIFGRLAEFYEVFYVLLHIQFLLDFSIGFRCLDRTFSCTFGERMS